MKFKKTAFNKRWKEEVEYRGTDSLEEHAEFVKHLEENTENWISNEFNVSKEVDGKWEPVTEEFLGFEEAWTWLPAFKKLGGDYRVEHVSGLVISEGRV